MPQRIDKISDSNEPAKKTKNFWEQYGTHNSAEYKKITKQYILEI